MTCMIQLLNKCQGPKSRKKGENFWEPVAHWIPKEKTPQSVGKNPNENWLVRSGYNQNCVSTSVYGWARLAVGRLEVGKCRP